MPIWDFANSFAAGVSDGRTHKRSLMQLQLQRDRLEQEQGQFDVTSKQNERDLNSNIAYRKSVSADLLADNKRADAEAKYGRMHTDRMFKREGEQYNDQFFEVNMDGTRPSKFTAYDGKVDPGKIKMHGTLAATLLRDANNFTYNSMNAKAQGDQYAWMRQRAEAEDTARRLGLAALGQYSGSQRASTVDYIPGTGINDYAGQYADPTAVGDDPYVPGLIQKQSEGVFRDEMEKAMSLVGSSRIPVKVDGTEQQLNMGDLLRADPILAQKLMGTIYGSAAPQTADYNTMFGTQGAKRLFDKYGHLRQYGLFPGMDDNESPLSTDDFDKVVRGQTRQ